MLCVVDFSLTTISKLLVTLNDVVFTAFGFRSVTLIAIRFVLEPCASVPPASAPGAPPALAALQAWAHQSGALAVEQACADFAAGARSGASVTLPGPTGERNLYSLVPRRAVLCLADGDDDIRKKIMKAKTDGGPTEPNSPKPDYIENIFLLMKLVSAPGTVQKFEADYNGCTIRYGDMKKQLAEDMVNFIKPIREKTEAIRNDHQYLHRVMEEGAAKARKSAGETMRLVRTAMGLNY